jgi:2-(1,2-epoxy-1,2-dihydrophenyl)acetyl-CoA isomerase
VPANNGEVLIHRGGHVAGLTLNRPGKRNALSLSLATALRDALGELAGDDSVRAVVIFGAGPSWCSGVDLDAFRSGDPAEAAAVDDPALANALRTMPQPCIAAINGGCITAGSSWRSPATCGSRATTHSLPTPTRSWGWSRSGG